MTKSGTTELTTVVGSATELMPGLESRWASLVKTSDVSSPFVSWGWYNAWLTAFCPSGDAQLIAVFDGDRLVGALPLWLNNSTLTSWVNTHSFRWSLLCERGNDRAARALASRLVQVENWDSCYLNYAVSESPSFNRFLSCLRQTGYPVETIPDMQSPVMHVPGTWDEFLASMPKKRRESERRKVRKLEKQGARFKFVMGRSDDLEALLEDCWTISARTWKQEKGSAIAADETRRSFYESIAASGEEWICLALMYLEDKPIAFEFNLLSDGTLYSLKLGYDTEFSRQSPGQVLRFKLFEWCIENNIDFFDFMGHRARYKDQYAASHVDHHNVRIYSKTFRGRLLGLYRVRIRPLLVSVKRSLMGVTQSLRGKDKNSKDS